MLVVQCRQKLGEAAIIRFPRGPALLPAAGKIGQSIAKPGIDSNRDDLLRTLFAGARGIEGSTNSALTAFCDLRF